MKSIKQLPKWSWVVLIVAVVAGVFIWHKNSADSNLIDNVKFSFSGYNESGTVVAVIPPEDEKKIAIMQLDYLRKKDFVDKSTAKTLKSLIEDANSINSVNTSTLTDSEMQILSTALNFKGGMLETKFSKSTNLHNGEKITYRWKVNNEDIPLKSGERTITVKGLKEPETLTAEKIKQKVKFKFYGLDGSGNIGIEKNEFGDADLKFSTANNGSLENGEKITIKVTTDSAQLKEAGYVFKGAHEFKLTVKDLADAKNVKNLDEAKKIVEKALADENKGRTTIEPTGKWYIGVDSSRDSYDFMSTPSDIKELTSRDLNSKRIIIGQIAKETHHYDEIVGGDDVEYEFVNYSFDLDLSDNTISVDSADEERTIDNVKLEGLEKTVGSDFSPLK